MRQLLLTLLMLTGLGGCVVESTNDTMARNKDPQKALRSYVELGMRYIQNHNMTQADRVLHKAADIDESDAALNNAYGLFYLVEKDTSKAEKYFTKAIHEDPEFSAAHNNYANLLYSQARYEDAVEHLMIVTKQYRYERRFQVFESLGNCYVKLDRPDDAEPAFLKALQLYPRLPGSLLALSELYFKKGNFSLSGQYLAQFESVSKPTPAQLWLGIRLQRQLGDADKLASYELALRRLFPGSSEFREYQKTISP